MRRKNEGNGEERENGKEIRMKRKRDNDRKGER